MYEVVQVIVKLILISAAILVATIVSFRISRSDLDIRQLLNPRRALSQAIDAHVSWLPVRAPDTIYQDGHAVAKIENVQLDSATSRIVFGEINRSNEL